MTLCKENNNHILPHFIDKDTEAQMPLLRVHREGCVLSSVLCPSLDEEHWQS